eukprot:TRINITY_DN1801_c0_g1_i7.p1 TRINITY_DN1801_c0_g1~~TRINITY_DN1801_c0_g1_i7.p1  ORF type:complete len:384 (-),score=59.56 TRINITY_DN1801_c0_g1_i7:80-1231(-)
MALHLSRAVRRVAHFSGISGSRCFAAVASFSVNNNLLKTLFYNQRHENSDTVFFYTTKRNFSVLTNKKNVPRKYCRGFSSPATGIDTNSNVQCVLEAVHKILEDAEIPEAETCSRYLVSQVLGSTKQFAYKEHLQQKLDNAQVEELNRLVACRLARMPVQYLAGNWDFREITLQVRPPVFIPRPETEQLVDIVLDHLPSKTSQRLLEVGPGTGNICLSLLHENPDIQVTALERSKMAADLTKENAKLLNLDQRLEVIEMKVEANTTLPPNSDQTPQPVQYDALVSNPPYVLRKDLISLAPEIYVYEDLRALDGGAEGLDVILNILRLALKYVKPDGLIFLEVDPCHPHILPLHLEKQALPFKIDKVLKDFQDKERFLILSRSS